MVLFTPEVNFVLGCADKPEGVRPKRYMPFAEGPRDCLGQNLAKVSLLATTATLLARLSFSLSSKVMLKHLLPPLSRWGIREVVGTVGGL